MVDDNALRLGNWLNFSVASLVLVIGLYYFFQSPLLKKKTFLKGVLAFWLGQWFVFAITWGRIIYIYPGKNDHVVLALGDLQSILAIGFSIAFLFGEELKNHWWAILKGLGLTYLLLLVINAAASVGALASGSNSGGGFIQLFLDQWVSTAQVLSLIADCLLGLAFVMRYGRLGLCMLATCVFYATLQSPIYGTLFGSPSMESLHIILALAFGKALLGAVFYWLFFEPAANYGRIDIPLQPAPKFELKGLLRRGGVLMLLAIFVAIIAFNFARSVTSPSLIGTIIAQLWKPLPYAALLIALYNLLSPKWISVHFTVNNSAETKPGDKIYLTGNCRELGDWWPGEIRAVPMDGTQYPTWTLDVELPAQREIQFKFIKVAAGALTWEGDPNHTYSVLGKGAGSVTKDWQR